MSRIGLLVVWALLITAGAACGADDILIADFEGPDYAGWKATGEAFGPGPARGTLPNQMPLSGFEGKGLVNSYFKGDGATGALTSPPFAIQRDYVVFLVGGGMHPGRACMNLRVDGRLVRTATGPNDKPGGTERLDWHTWDVRPWKGNKAVLEIVDLETGGWGHINIDHILLTDRSRGVVATSRTIRIQRDYLSFQFGAGQGQRCRIGLSVDGKQVRQAVGRNSETAYWISWDVAKLRGKNAELAIAELPAAGGATPLAKSVQQADDPKGAVIVVDKLYRETYRPQFHFSPRTNWTNDPNGLVYYRGEYHLFFQHNPEGINWGNMTWGHAVSRDLVRWKQLDHAIYPDKLGTIFSGSAVVDATDTAGLQTGVEKPLVCIYTSAGGSSPESKGHRFTQSIAYSNDRGRTWAKLPGNPVLGHVAGDNRDPKVLWHEPTKKWVMALYLDGDQFALFGSNDLKSWSKLCVVAMPGTSECPDFFELPVDGDRSRTKWVYWGANGNYRLGTFDGTTFRPETPPLKSLSGANDYAAQTYSDIPVQDGRRIQIAWMAGGGYPEMPFNQQMSFPRELSLRTTAEGVRLFMEPVREIASLRTAGGLDKTKVPLEPGKNAVAGLEGELWDVDAAIAPGGAQEIVLAVRGEPIRYDVKTKTLSCLGRTATVEPIDGLVKLRVLVDRTTIEIFAADGRVTMCSCFLPNPADRSLTLSARGGKAVAEKLAIHPLKSAWE